MNVILIVRHFFPSFNNFFNEQMVAYKFGVAKKSNNNLIRRWNLKKIMTRGNEKRIRRQFTAQNSPRQIHRAQFITYYSSRKIKKSAR
jgi:uncharacterized protein YktA (UPF0223 family)